MTTLSEALQSLIHNFKIEIEQGCIIFKPGLLKTEIEEITRTLPFCLPQEVCKLYSWSNGDRIGAYKVFGGLRFLSLEEALQTYNEILKGAKKQAIINGRDTSQTWWNQYWFPIFAMGEGCYFVIGSQESKKSSPVFCYDYKDWNDIRPKYKYTSLTSMIQVITKCHQANAYQLIAGEYGDYLEEDYEKVESIRLKYNPDARGTYYDLISGETFYYPGF